MATNKYWLKNPDNIVKDKVGRLWYADGFSPYPINGFNFAKIERGEKVILGLFKQKGYYVYPGTRWVFTDPNAFDIVK